MPYTKAIFSSRQFRCNCFRHPRILIACNHIRRLLHYSKKSLFHLNNEDTFEFVNAYIIITVWGLFKFHSCPTRPLLTVMVNSSKEIPGMSRTTIPAITPCRLRHTPYRCSSLGPSLNGSGSDPIITQCAYGPKDKYLKRIELYSTNGSSVLPCLGHCGLL